MARAATESLAYAIKGNLDQLEAVSGQKAQKVSLGGGMTQSPNFVKILAAVLGRKVLVSPIPQVSALGAALCAATGVGIFSSLEEASSTLCLKAVEPDPVLALEYRDYYQQWLAATKDMESLKP